ncbi:MAG: gliding motility-associated C-terminal domain-containing protein [Saprospiraceae bacterium]|nr:gliding motility-associated C-terminal domain-containing protein [Saprospiraceae bacterium]
MSLKYVMLIVCSMCFIASGYAQEICNNGVDDDNNGLVDLNDPACECTGIQGGQQNATSKIPNPDFELKSCCPNAFTQFDCLDNWVTANEATPDFMHECDFIFPAVNEANLVPFPSGEGAVGGIFTTALKEYIGVCLNQPMVAGKSYTLTFNIAFISWMLPSYGLCNSPQFYPPLDIAVYGNPSCGAFPAATFDCLEDADPTWSIQGETGYDPIAMWQSISITFTPVVDMNAIAIGPSCQIPDEYVINTCIPYFLFDNFTLLEESENGELKVDVTGDFCQGDLQIAAIGSPLGGVYQWYYNGVALIGEINEYLDFSGGNFMPGEYSVSYTVGGDCISETVDVQWTLPEPSQEEVFFCTGSSVECAGEVFLNPGIYDVTLESYTGCDSVVTCTVTQYQVTPTTFLNIDTCGPAIISSCGEQFEQSGLYYIFCLNQFGCDSIVELNLILLEPVAIIQPPGLLSCKDSISLVTLDGTLSTINPEAGGTTSYQWTGPPNGIISDDTKPFVDVELPGTDCMEVTHTSNGVSCTDIACVVVEGYSALPVEPQLLTAQGCVGQLNEIRAILQSISDTAYLYWIIPSGISLVSASDSILTVTADQPGDSQVCAFLSSECGISDTTCLTVSFLFPDTTQLFSTTCDPVLAVTDTSFLENQYGCDSLIITQIDLLPSSIKNIQLYTCDPSEAGQDTLHLTNQYGCDSIVYLNTTYTGIYQETNAALICGVGTNYADTLTVVSGPCDSLFITEYHYAPLDTTWLTGTTCQAGQAGTFTQVLQGQSGCDSTIISTISLLQGDTTMVNDVTCVKANEQSDTLILQNQYGCDSMVILSIAYVGIDTQNVQKNSCDPAQVGVVIQSIPGTYCDTIRVTETSWVPFTESRDTITLCMASGPASDTLVLAGQSGCDSLVIHIYHYTDLQAEVVLQKETCAGSSDGSIQILTTDGGDSPYSYRLDGGAWQQTGTFAGLPPGTYTLEIKDQNDCLLQTGGQLIEAGSTLILDAGPDRTEKLGEVINLSVQATAQLADVQWTATDPLGCASCPQSALGPLTVSQTVVVTGISLEGCPGQDELTVAVDERLTIYIPNSFSPNGDGINDLFTVYSNEEGVIVKNLDIFDRWGNALYNQKDLPVHDPTVGWNGTFRGEIMDPGVYVYMIKIELADGSQRYYKGDVTIIR